MLLNRDEIRQRLNAAYETDPDDNGGVGKELYWQTMKDILQHAEALGEPVLLFEARLAYGWSLNGKSWKKKSSEITNEWLSILRRCLLMWHAEPHRFPEYNVAAMWKQFFNIVGGLERLFPEPAARLHRLLDELERYSAAAPTWTRYAIDHYRMSLEARRGNLDEVERLWRRLSAQGEPGRYFHLDGKAAIEATMWKRFGRDDRAIAALAPVLTGQVQTRPGCEHADDLLVPYLRTGRLDDAVSAHQRTYTRTGMKLEDVASHLEFCARSGNEERGLDVLRRNLHRVGDDVTSVEGMWTAAAAALLCRRVMERDLDEEWVWPCGAGCECDAGLLWSYADLGSVLRWEVVNFARHLDELNETSHQSEGIAALLGAEPIVDRLDLPPDSAEPRHRAVPPFSAQLAAATVEDLRDGLEKARAMEQGRAKILTMQRLVQNATALGDPETLLELRFAYLDELASRGPKSWRPNLFAALAGLVRWHAAEPELFGADRLDRLWTLAPLVLDRVLTHATVHTAQIRGLLRALEPHGRPGTDDLHQLHWFQVGLEARCGDPDAARAAWARFAERAPAGTRATQPDLLRRTQWWLDLGCDHEAVQAMAPLLTGDVHAEEDREDYLLMPYLRAGLLDKAREVHERTYLTAERPPEVAAQLQYCARTGELEHGRQIIQRRLELYHVSYDDSDFTFDDLRSYAGVIRMSRCLVDNGRDEHWTWPADRCCEAQDGWNYTKLAKECTEELDVFATRWDELLGTPFHSRRARSLATGD